MWTVQASTMETALCAMRRNQLESVRKKMVKTRTSNWNYPPIREQKRIRFFFVHSSHCLVVWLCACVGMPLTVEYSRKEPYQIIRTMNCVYSEQNGCQTNIFESRNRFRGRENERKKIVEKECVRRRRFVTIFQILWVFVELHSSHSDSKVHLFCRFLLKPMEAIFIWMTFYWCCSWIHFVCVMLSIFCSESFTHSFLTRGNFLYLWAFFWTNTHRRACTYNNLASL